MGYSKQKIKKEWIQNEITNETVEWANEFGKFLTEGKGNRKESDPLSTSQIRKFFGELKRIQADPIKYKSDIALLKAKLAYAVGRDKKNGKDNKTKIKEFNEELSQGINYVVENGNKKEDFVRFVKIVESVVAFHKFHGGE